jgi:tetratricopeptide (TPR) repeat protein
MFERRWPDACRQYREIVETDSTSFAGWYGLAECNASDPVVARDPRDTSRFAFRGSWHTAVLAYRRALLLAPSFNFIFGRRAAERLTRILQAEIYWWRAGQRDAESFYAFPVLEGDTLAFHPVPAAQAETLPAGTPPHVAAVARNRAILIEVTAAWAAAFPRDARAHRALAYALEVNGNIAPAAEAPRSALTEIQAAQRLEPRQQDRVGDAVAAVRLLVKAGEFEGARRLGDSLLRAAPRGVVGPAGVAVLLGRPALAARLVAPEDPETEYPGSADNQSVTIPMAALRVGLELLAYASAGAPAESVAALEQRVEQRTSGLPVASRPAVRSALLDVPAELVFDAMGPRPAHRSTPPGPSRPMAMQWALAQGDTASARATITSELGQRGGLLSRDDSPPDGVYLDARLLLALGDTAAAERTLDTPLNSLARLHSYLLRYLPLAGSLVRMMALRAEVADWRGDAPTARRWAEAVLVLWSGAEPALRPVVARMRQIAATR